MAYILIQYVLYINHCHPLRMYVVLIKLFNVYDKLKLISYTNSFKVFKFVFRFVPFIFIMQKSLILLTTFRVLKCSVWRIFSWYLLFTSRKKEEMIIGVITTCPLESFYQTLAFTLFKQVQQV